MISLPDKLIGERVLLRPFLESDVTPEYVSWLNDPIVVKYSNQRFVRHTLDTCHRYFESFAGSDNLFIAICRVEDGLMVGTMTAYRDTHHGTVDVGIMVGHRAVWGTGVGQESWNLLLGWLGGQSDIRKITAGTMACNMAMVKLMERSAMQLEATRQEQELLDGEPQDIAYYGKMCGA